MTNVRARIGFGMTMLVLAACGAPAPDTSSVDLHLRTTAVANGGALPAAFTCNGARRSPPLAWSAPPATTEAFALVVTDRDSPLQPILGPFVHWLAYDIPAQTRRLPGGAPATDTLPGGGEQGTNGFGTVGYGAPCPPGNASHRYAFTLYALDAKLDLPPGAKMKALVDAMRGHVVAAGSISAHYP